MWQLASKGGKQSLPAQLRAPRIDSVIFATVYESKLSQGLSRSKEVERRILLLDRRVESHAAAAFVGQEILLPDALETDPPQAGSVYSQGVQC